MNHPTTITALLVEDDTRLAQLTREYLEQNELIVTVVSDGARGLEESLSGRYDVLVLDIMLPVRSGTEICRQVRERSDVPIIMLTARGEEADRVMGLELGADDYLTKPFSARELLARIHALVRRSRGQTGPSAKTVKVGELTIDPSTRNVRLSGRDVDLTGYEFDLLLALTERAGRVLSREQLMELARGSAEEAFDRSIDVHISKLRAKLGDDPRHPARIKTIRGVGYQYSKED